MKSLMSMLSFFANRAVVYVVAAILVLVAMVYLYQRSIQGERTEAKAEAEVVNTVAQSTLQAVETQMQTNSAASQAYIEANAATQAKAQQRQQEVLHYVQTNTPNTPYVPCPTDDEFIRLYNHRGNTATQAIP